MDRIDPLARLDFNLSPYSYVGNNPLIFMDLFGLERVPVGSNGGYYDLEAGEVGIVGKRMERETPNTSIVGLAMASYSRNEKLYGHPSPYREYFQKGGEDAIKFIGGGVAAIYGSATLLSQQEVLWLIRKTLSGQYGRKILAAKGGFNLLGQGVSNAVRGEAKFDLLGLGADLFFTNGASTVVGAVGEFGFDFKARKINIEHVENLGVGIGKLATGFGLGAFGDKATSFLGANGFSDTAGAFTEGVTKIINEMTNSMIEKINDKQTTKKQ